MQIISSINTKYLFESEHLKHDLGRKSVRGGITTMSAQGVTFILTTTRTMILARLLTKADFGIISMVMVVVGFAGLFKDVGLSMATIQKDKINEAQISTLFWCNFTLSAFIGLCVVLASPLVSVLYKQPPFSTLTWVTMVLSVSFLFSGLTIQHQALMRRHMMFTQIAYVNIVTQIFSLVVAVSLTWAGWRYWALVGSTIAQTGVNFMLVFLYCPWRPKKPKKGTGVREMLKFGGHLTGFDFVNYFARNGDNLLIGRYIGEGALGVYSRAYALFLMPISQLTKPVFSVAIPAMAALQNDPEKYRTYYRKIIEMLAICTIPLAGFSIVFADPIVRLLLGDQWLAAIPVFRLLAVAGLMQSVVSTGGAVMTTLGHSKRYFYQGLANALLCILGFCIGLYFGGLIGLVWGYLVANYVIIIPTLIVSFYKTPITIGLFARAVAPSFVSTIVAMAFAFAVFFVLHCDYYVDNAVAGAAYMGACLLPWFCIKSWRNNVTDVFRYIKRGPEQKTLK